MKFLIVGRGSMSNRRQRCLKALGHNDFIAWDITDEKPIEQVMEEYKPDAMIISCPPKTKGKYIALAAKYQIPAFAEADTVSYDEGPYYPSSSLRFHPAIQKMHELLNNGTLGKIYCFTYHQGMHLRDWRPSGFNFKGYYAAEQATAEMFAFELSWLSYLFGTPVNACGMIDKKLDDPDITADDIYSTVVRFASGEECVDRLMFKKDILSPNELQKMVEELEQGKSIVEIPCKPSEVSWAMKQPTITGTILVDILSRPAIRELHIVCERGFIEWNWNYDHVEIERPDGEIELILYEKGKAAPGYNENICEDMYENELKNWVEAINGGTYRYSREEECRVIEMLRKIDGRHV